MFLTTSSRSFSGCWASTCDSDEHLKHSILIAQIVQLLMLGGSPFFLGRYMDVLLHLYPPREGVEGLGELLYQILDVGLALDGLQV